MSRPVCSGSSQQCQNQYGKTGENEPSIENDG